MSAGVRLRKVDLRAECWAAIADGKQRVLLLLPGQRPRGEHKRLLGRRGPLGRFIRMTSHMAGRWGGCCLVEFDAQEVLDYLDRELA